MSKVLPAFMLGQRRIEAVLFDLDGTLIDTAPDFIRIIKHMCVQKGVIAPSDADIRAQVSEGARAMVALVAPHSDEHTLLALRSEFLALYMQEIAVDTCLFAGMDALLKRLEVLDIPWGIVTNKPRALAEKLLAALRLTKRCAVLVCPDDVAQTKPHPEPMLKAASALNILPEYCVYVGDHPRDIDAGRAANMPTILAAYGYLPPESKDNLAAWQADYVVHSVAALTTLLLV